MESSNNNGFRIGFTGLLLLAFIILKLTNVIGWSWWWVLSPLWVSLGIALVVFLVGLIITVIKASRG